MVLNYSLSWPGKLTLQRERNEGAGEKTPDEVSAKCPGVIPLLECWLLPGASPL